MLNTLALIAFMQALFALTFPVGKLALHYTGTLFLVGLRMVLGCCLLLIAHALWGEQKKISRTDWFLLAQMALFAVYLAFVPEFWALKSMSAIKTNMLWSALPFVSALLSYFLLGERLNFNKWCGLLCGLVGMLPVIMLGSPQEFKYGEFLHISLPDCMMLLAVVSCAYGWFLMKQLMQRGFSIIFINGVSMLLGGILCFITKAVELWYTGSHEPLYSQLGPVLGYTLILIIISNVIGYNLYGYLLRRCSLTFLSFTGFLCPLFGIVFSKLLLHEQVHYQYIFSLGAVCVGLWIFYQDELLTHKDIGCKE